MKSQFKIISYKVDTCSFSSLKDLGALELDCLPPSAWRTKIAMRPPVFFEEKKRYVAGMDVFLSVVLKSEDPKNQDPILSLHMGIGGSFEIEGPVEEKQKEKIVKAQFPAILFPFLRSALSSFLLHSGFGNFILPLINVHSLADSQLKEVEIGIVKKPAEKDKLPQK